MERERNDGSDWRIVSLSEDDDDLPVATDSLPAPRPVSIGMSGVEQASTDYWSGFRAGVAHTASQFQQVMSSAMALPFGNSRHPRGGADESGADEGQFGTDDSVVIDLEPQSDASSNVSDFITLTSPVESSDHVVIDLDSQAWLEGDGRVPPLEGVDIQCAMHWVLGQTVKDPGHVTTVLKAFCSEHLACESVRRCRARLFSLALAWRTGNTGDERDAGAILIVWIRAYAERHGSFRREWQGCELERFLADVEMQFQNQGESSLATPLAVLRNLLQAGYTEDDLFELLSRALADLDRKAKAGDEGVGGMDETLLMGLYDQLISIRLSAAQQTMAGWVPEAVQHQVQQITSLVRQGPHKAVAHTGRIVIGVLPALFVQKPACIFLGRCVARQTVESIFDALRQAGYSNKEIAAIFGILSTGTLAAGYAYMLLHRSRHALPQQYRHWRLSTVLMQAGQLSAILLGALGPAVAGALVPDVYGKTMRWGAVAAFTATQAYMTIVSKFVRQTFQSGSSGPMFPLLQLNGVPKGLKVRQQMFRDAAGILGAALVTALSIWCPIPPDSQTLVTRVITEDFYLLLTDWFSDDPTELASVMLMRWFPGELDRSTLSITPKDVPNPFGLSSSQLREGVLEVLDNGCSRVFNGLGDTLSLAATSYSLAGQPGVSMVFKFLNLMVKAPLSTRRSTLLTVLRTGVGDPRGIQSRALSTLAGWLVGHEVELDGDVVTRLRDLSSGEVEDLCLVAFDRRTRTFRPAHLGGGVRVRVLTLPEGRGRYRFFVPNMQDCQLPIPWPYFHQVCEVHGRGNNASLAAFNMVAMELLGRQSPDAEHAYAWLLDTVSDESGHTLSTSALSWESVLAHFHRMHPRAPRLRLQRLHWNALGQVCLDRQEQGVRRRLRSLKPFGLSLIHRGNDTIAHVLVLPMGRRFVFFSPQTARPMLVTPQGWHTDPLDAICWWKDQLLTPTGPAAESGGLVEIDAVDLDSPAVEIEILSLAPDEETV